LPKGRIAAARGQYSLYYTMGRPFSLKIAPSHPANTCMVTWAHPSPQAKGISIGSVLFAGLTMATDRQTDRPRYIGNNRPHLHTQYCIAA